MATSKTSSTYNRQSWEDAEFPILCQTCLGDNPYIRMTKEKYGKECKICARPFTVFRWCPGARMRFKKTEVCQTCARLKNVCQTCLLDLEYGLPIQVRDTALKIKDDIPKSDVNKEYYIQNMDHEIGKIDGTTAAGSLGKAHGSSELLMKLARTTPYYKRNRPHICSFWVKGECRRGEECPYRHEKPTDPDDPLADQNIKDRYYGVNDPVAEKLMARASTMPKLEPPEDKSITTLYVGNLGDKLTEEDLRDHFYQFGEIRSVSILSKQGCAFIQFTTRAATEAAVEACFNKVILGGRRLNIKWGRAPANKGNEDAAEANKTQLEPVPGLPGPLPAPPKDFFNLSETSGGGPFPPPFLPPPPMPPMMGLPPGMPPPPPFFFPHQMRFPPMFGPPRPPMFQAGGEPPNPAPATSSSVHYPSQDPLRMGSVD